MKRTDKVQEHTERPNGESAPVLDQATRIAPTLLGNPALGAVAGGPVGAGVGVLTARSIRSDHNIRALQDDLARLDAELALQCESLRRLARERWLEP